MNESVFMQNPLNNQQANLRIVNRQESKGKHEYLVEGYRGVYFHKRKNQYIARVRFYGLTYHLGYFDTIKEACVAFNNKTLELYGNVAKLNKIGDTP